ncbi:hypothetical protein PV-S19_0232 [Pacmanvirus S19]|nr:hypothetical protein PV-S19_0232 [Pacmanvirus S19]
MNSGEIIIGILVLIVLYLVYITFIRKYLGLTRVSVDNRQWNVISAYQNKQEAAQLMNRVNIVMINFMRRLKKKYHIDEPSELSSREGISHYEIVNSPNDVYNIVDHLLDNYNPEKFYENDPTIANETSYTMNKGAAMYLCLRSKDDPSILVDFDTLLFVLIHESAHIANYNDIGHSVKFWTVFKFLLHEAREAGIYTPIDYRAYPKDYCGLSINYQPLFDDNLPNLWE